MPLSTVRDVAPGPPSLLQRLGEALREHAVVYSQWPGCDARRRETAGGGDIELLVDRASAAAFAAVMARLDFKQAAPAPGTAIPGTEDFFGSDPRASTLIHVRARYRLILGDWWTTQYHLPIEQAVLQSAVPHSPLHQAPAASQLLAFVLSAVLGHALRDDLETRRSDGAGSLQDHLGQLVRHADPAAVHQLLRRHLPSVSPALFDACVRTLQTQASRRQRAAVRRELRRRLDVHARRPSAGARLRRIASQLWTLGGQLRARAPGRRLAGGGAVIALVGGDGAGKSTCARELSKWLGQAFATMTVNVAWPRRSLASLAVGGALRASALIAQLLGAEPLETPPWNESARRFPGYLAVLRHVCNARDRHRLSLDIHRFAEAGGVALCERYPIPQHPLLDGPRLPELVSTAPSRRLATLLRDAEGRYYRQLPPPDRVIVLLVDPDLAVRRKPLEPVDHVRQRAGAVWDTDWAGTRAHVVDAGRPLPEVLAALKSTIWAEL